MSVLTDIFTEISQSTYYVNMIAAHRANGVPVDAWLSPENIGVSLTQIFAAELSNLRSYVSTYAQAGFLETATLLNDKTALDLLASSQYSLTRNQPKIAQLNVRLLSASFSPNYSFSPGQITIGTQGSANLQKNYTNITGGTVVPGGFLDLVFAAAEPGSSYNIPNNTVLDMKTAFIGISVSNPIYPPSTSCILQQGADVEENPSYAERCETRWGTLGAGGNDDAMIYWALSIPPGYTSSPVRKVFVAPNYYKGRYIPNGATVYIAGTAGALPPADIAAVQSILDNPKKYPLTHYVFVDTVINVNIIITGFVYVRRKASVYSADIIAQISEHMIAYQDTLQIGQTMYQQKIGARIEDANTTAIRNVVLTSPLPVVSIDFIQYPVLDYTGLSIVEVD